MKYYKRIVKTHKCGPTCKGHTIYYGVNEKSWLSVPIIRCNAFKDTDICSSGKGILGYEKRVSALEVALALISGNCAVDDVLNIHDHEKVFITGKLFVDKE